MPGADRDLEAGDLAHAPGQRRYWAEEVDRERGRVFLDREEAHHVLGVMRHRAGDRVWVIDGRGGLYLVTIEDREVGGDRLTARICEELSTATEPPAPWLVQARIRPTRMEPLLDGAVQVGVRGVLLFDAVRSPVHDTLSAARRERLCRVMRQATLQSLGHHIPELRGPIASTELPGALAGFRIWVAHGPVARDGSGGADPASWPDLPGGERGHALVIGPEGGLTEDEVGALLGAGATLLDLGPRRLRAETAAVVGLALLGARLRAASPPG